MHLILPIPSNRYYDAHFTDGKTEVEMLSNLTKVTQLTSRKVQNSTQKDSSL